MSSLLYRMSALGTGGRVGSSSVPDRCHPQSGCHPYFSFPHLAQEWEKPDLSPAYPYQKVSIVFQSQDAPSLKLPTH